MIPLITSEKEPEPLSESTLTAKIEAFVAGPNLLEKLSEIPIVGNAVFGLHSGGGASSVGAMAISIGVGITAEGGKPGGTSGEGLVLDVDSGIDT